MRSTRTEAGRLLNRGLRWCLLFHFDVHENVCIMLLWMCDVSIFPPPVCVYLSSPLTSDLRKKLCNVLLFYSSVCMCTFFSMCVMLSPTPQLILLVIMMSGWYSVVTVLVSPPSPLPNPYSHPPVGSFNCQALTFAEQR